MYVHPKAVRWQREARQAACPLPCPPSLVHTNLQAMGNGSQRASRQEKALEERQREQGSWRRRGGARGRGRKRSGGREEGRKMEEWEGKHGGRSEKMPGGEEGRREKQEGPIPDCGT